MLVNFASFSCRLLTFFKINFSSKNSLRNTTKVSICLDPDQPLRNTTKVSIGLDPDQDRHFDLGPNCLQRLSEDDKNCR